MIESRPIPATAKTAHSYMLREYLAACEMLGQQVVSDLGFTESDNWTVDIRRGVMRREVPDPPATEAAPASEA